MTLKEMAKAILELPPKLQKQTAEVFDYSKDSYSSVTDVLTIANETVLEINGQKTKEPSPKGPALFAIPPKIPPAIRPPNVKSPSPTQWQSNNV